jgi:thymidylate synthase (FAD)
MTTVKLVLEPTVIPLAEMTLDPKGLEALMEWVRDYRPECLPKEDPQPMDLFPHDLRDDGRDLTGDELLVELAGRNCYHSYGAKAGRKTNREYIAHSQSGTVPHRSIMYHAKMTFFIGGISRRVSHELIRHYVGADRTEEGSPSQESTRYTHHPGHFIVPPRILDTSPDAVVQFRQDMEQAYKAYLDYEAREVQAWTDRHGKPPTGMDRKRIYEAAAGLLPMQASTSMIWTTNPVALAKLFLERTDSSADAEFQRLAKHWQSIAVGRWPNLFHQG